MRTLWPLLVTRAVLIAIVLLAVTGYTVHQNGALRGERDSYKNLALVADADRAAIQLRLDRCRGIR